MCRSRLEGQTVSASNEPLMRRTWGTPEQLRDTEDTTKQEVGDVFKSPVAATQLLCDNTFSRAETEDVCVDVLCVDCQLWTCNTLLMTWFLSLSAFTQTGREVVLNTSEYYWHIWNNFDCHAAIYSDRLRQMCVTYLMHVQIQITNFFSFF